MKHFQIIKDIFMREDELVINLFWQPFSFFDCCSYVLLSYLSKCYSDILAIYLLQPLILVIAARPASSGGSPVIGIIDGKFESGYLVTVTIGSEKLKGVLYQAPQNPIHQVPSSYNVINNNTATAHAVSGVQRRRRRKKSEIKRRDPAHPKPNRSGYNFFFAEQHARLKPLHPGKDREISRMIGELWNKLKESEKAVRTVLFSTPCLLLIFNIFCLNTIGLHMNVPDIQVYQEKALKDKERYRIEMEDYRERLKTGQVISDAVPLQQRLPGADVDMVEVDTKLDETGGDSPQTPDNESSSDGSDFEDDKTVDKDTEMEESLGVRLGTKTSNVDLEISAQEPALELPKTEENTKDSKVETVTDDIVRNDVVEKASDDCGESLAIR